MFNKLAIALLFVLGVAYAATDSETVSSLLVSLQTKLTKSTTLQGTMDEFTEANERLMKENKVLADNRDLQQKGFDKFKAAVTKEYDMEFSKKQAEVDKVIDEFNSFGCVGELPEAKYNQCTSLLAQYTARVEQMKADGNAYLERKVAGYNAQLEPLANVIERQTARIDEIADSMKTNFDGFLKSQEEQQKVNAQIAKIRVKLTELCSAENVSVAAKQLCNGVNWDGKRTDLPDLTTVRPPLSIAPNK